MTYENRLLAHQWTKKKGDEVEGIWWVLAMLTKKKKMVLELKKPMTMLSGSFDSGHG